MRTAGAIIIGNEVLAGHVEEQNAKLLIRELHAAGIQLCRISFIPDEVSAIAEMVRDHLKRFDGVFTSGGLGATHDDVTLKAVAQALDRPLQESPELIAYLERRLGSLLPVQRQLAWLPEGSELLGLDTLLYPLLRLDRLYLLPGVPEYFANQLAFLRPQLQTQAFVQAALFLNVYESAIAVELGRLAEAYPALAFGSYPAARGLDYRTKLTVESRDAAQVEAAYAELVQLCSPAWIVKRSPPSSPVR